MKRHILSSLILLFPVVALADAELSCTSGHFRSLNQGQVTVSPQTYCYDKTKTQLYSRDCLNQKCLAFKSEKTYSFKELFSQIGNPGFTLCRKLQGHPEILDFKSDGEWYTLDRCLFSDGSFVNTDQLMKYYFRTRKGLN